MFAILHALGMFVADLFKSQSRLEAENVFLRHQLTIAMRHAPVLSEISIRWRFSQRFSLFCGKQFPVSSTKFPVLMRREFGCNQLTYSRKTKSSSHLRG